MSSRLFFQQLKSVSIYSWVQEPNPSLTGYMLCALRLEFSVSYSQGRTNQIKKFKSIFEVCGCYDCYGCGCVVDVVMVIVVAVAETDVLVVIPIVAAVSKGAAVTLVNLLL